MNDYINVITMLLKAGTDYQSKTVYDDDAVYIAVYDEDSDMFVNFVFDLDGKFVKTFVDNV